MICSWCKTKDGAPLSPAEYKATTLDDVSSHGICKKCADIQRHENNIYLGEKAVNRNLTNHEKRLLKLDGWYACAACDHIHPGVCLAAIATGDIKPLVALTSMAHTHTGAVYTIVDQRYPAFNGRTIAGKTVLKWA